MSACTGEPHIERAPVSRGSPPQFCADYEQPGVFAGTHFGGCGFGPWLEALAARGAVAVAIAPTANATAKIFRLISPPFGRWGIDLF
jgi:hypothetical protein